MTFRKRKHIHPFYPEAEKWTAWRYPKQQSTGVKKIKQIPIHRIIVPEPELIVALKTIKQEVTCEAVFSDLNFIFIIIYSH